MKKNMCLLVIALLMTICAKAQQYVNPLERWATHNVDELNTFATGEPDVTRGKLYQFGRNIPLSTVNGVEVPTTEKVKASSLTDPVVWTEDLLITSPDNPDNWYVGGTATDTWESIVAQTMAAMGIPVTYKGNNNGCPCPEGWRLPTANEFNAILSKSKAILLDPDTESRAIIDDLDETDIDLDGSGNVATYKADYRVISVAEAFGLRFKGTPQATAFHYIYGDKSVVISAKAAGNATIEQIALDWKSTDWDDAVVRHFPRLGYRGWESRHLYNGHPENDNDSRGYYFTNTVNGEKQIWAAGFYLSSAGLRTLTHGAMTRRHAFALRCVRENELSGLTYNKINDISVWSPRENVLRISGTDVQGRIVRIYDLLGASIHVELAKKNELEISLSKGFYVVNVGKESVKAMIK